MTPKQAYINKLNDLAGRYGNLEDATVRRMIAMLQDLRQSVIAQLSAAPTEWSQFRLADFQANIARQIAEFETRFALELRDMIPGVYELGSLTAVEPLQAAGIGALFNAPTRAQVNVLLDYSVDLVRQITGDINRAISAQVRLAALGQQTPFAAMRGITSALGMRGGKPVEGISARAETILRTELQRTYNLANHSQQMMTAESVPGLTKRWIATADNRTRPGHLRIHRETATKPIPVKSKFKVYDIDAKGRGRGSALLAFPGDPSVGPQFTVNCRCRMATIHPTLGVIGSSLDGRIAAELTRRGI